MNGFCSNPSASNHLIHPFPFHGFLNSNHSLPLTPSFIRANTKYGRDDSGSDSINLSATLSESFRSPWIKQEWSIDSQIKEPGSQGIHSATFNAWSSLPSRHNKSIKASIMLIAWCNPIPSFHGQEYGHSFIDRNSKVAG